MMIKKCQCFHLLARFISIICVQHTVSLGIFCGFPQRARLHKHIQLVKFVCLLSPQFEYFWLFYLQVNVRLSQRDYNSCWTELSLSPTHTHNTARHICFEICLGISRGGKIRFNLKCDISLENKVETLISSWNAFESVFNSLPTNKRQRRIN